MSGKPRRAKSGVKLATLEFWEIRHYSDSVTVRIDRTLVHYRPILLGPWRLARRVTLYTLSFVLFWATKDNLEKALDAN